MATLKHPLTLTYGWANIPVTFPQGTPCLPAHNQPKDSQGRARYWIDGNPEPDNVILSGWIETYGFLVTHDDVEA